jgi:hypothetical protein
MTAEEARRTLKVSPDASMDDIRSAYKRLARTYHPDNIRTGDGNTFVLVAAAYFVLRSNDVGIDTDDQREDYEYVLNLRQQLKSYFDDAVTEFSTRLHQSEERAKRYVTDAVNGASSFDDLRTVVDKQISSYLTDTIAEIRAHLRLLDAKLRRSKDDFVFKVFEEMYAERRRYWLLSLYKNPVTVLEVVGLSFLFLLRHHAELQLAFPHAAKAAMLWWVPVLVAGAGIVAIGVQYTLLNPKRQFVPPSLSTGSIHHLLSKHVSEQIGSGRGELALGGSFIFGALGTLILPGIGTLIGAALGALVGLFGNDLYETKIKVKDTILSQLDIGLQQIRDQVRLWATSFANDLELAVLRSFGSNVRKVAGLLSTQKLPIKRLAAARRLLTGESRPNGNGGLTSR